MKIQAKRATMTFVSKETEKYQLEATAQYQVGGKMTDIQGGMVHNENKQVAGFSRYGSNDNFNINFTGVDAIEQQDILAAVNEFIIAVEAEVKSNI